MLPDFEIQRCTRRCAATERPLEPGEECFSLLVADGAAVSRHDFSTEAWRGPPEHAIGWWKTRVPEPNAKKIKLAPNEVLLNFFDQLADQPANEDMRYVLALLLLRRRVLRLETTAAADDTWAGQRGRPPKTESIFLSCPKRDASYEVAVAMPDEQRIDEIQQQLSELLLAGAE
jgi:hypothetical protein